MPDPAITAFLEGRKTDWLEKGLKKTSNQDEIQSLREEATRRFSKKVWLTDAAKRASQRAFSTHPGKFSHPSTGISDKNRKNNTYVTPVIHSATRASDGYLRSGNVEALLDSLGNAAALDVDSFLSLQMEDKQSLLEHIQQDTYIAKELLTIEGENYQSLKDGFLAMAGETREPTTSTLIKQVFFPVEAGYHQLSLLTNSGMVYELKRRLDVIRFSDETKEAREKKKQNAFSDNGFDEIYQLITIGYGGTKPQNISVLNNRNAGKAYLLSSVPPALAPRNIRPPKTDFFRETLYFKKCANALEGLHRIFTTGINSEIPRKNLLKGRDKRVDEILTYILEQVWQVRSLSTQLNESHTSNLGSAQKIWLLDLPDYQDKRYKETDWLSSIVEDITGWILNSYKKQLGKEAVLLDQAERDWLHELIENHREALL